MPRVLPFVFWELAEMANVKHKIITMPRLQSALDDVVDELDEVGLWNPRLAKVDVFLTWFGTYYGWQWYRGSGHIEIPAVSLSRVNEMIYGGPRMTLRDLLRHEYGHAVADTNRALVRSRRFAEVFGTPHDSEIPADHSEHEHVTDYAAEDSSEDFAEVFRYYLKHSGKIPRRYKTRKIERKWQFVDRLCQRIADGKRRWAT
jgi:hypothetical protein